MLAIMYIYAIAVGGRGDSGAVGGYGGAGGSAGGCVVGKAAMLIILGGCGAGGDGGGDDNMSRRKHMNSNGTSYRKLPKSIHKIRNISDVILSNIMTRFFQTCSFQFPRLLFCA